MGEVDTVRESTVSNNAIHIPNKLYFKIGEVARIVGVKPYVLRYWETEFPEVVPPKSRGNQRLYRRKDVECMIAIRDLLYRERFTIEGARKHLRGYAARKLVPPFRETVSLERVAEEMGGVEETAGEEAVSPPIPEVKTAAVEPHNGRDFNPQPQPQIELPLVSPVNCEIGPARASEPSRDSAGPNRDFLLQLKDKLQGLLDALA